MPISVSDFTWSQTETSVEIRVPSKGIHPSKTDILTSDNYIKAHFPPFIFEVFLHGAIVDSRSKCSLTGDELIFVLCKTMPGLWPQLQAELDRDEKKKVRELAVAKQHEEAEARRKHIVETQVALEKISVREQIELNSQERAKLESVKDEVKKSAFRTISTWHNPESTDTMTSGSRIRITELTDEGATPCPVQRPHAKRDCESVTETVCKSVVVKKFPPPRPKKKDPPPPPPPRCAGEILVKFSEREFPTPRRESTEPEEQQWLQKQREARSKAGFTAEDLRPEEKDLLWLKEKGDSFLLAGNWLGAVSAYSHALSMGSRHPSLYCNRAAAHLSLGNLHKAVEDCSLGLELLSPATAANTKSRARCHARRGAALCKLGSATHGLLDLKAALKLCPDDEKLGQDVRRAEILVQQNLENASSNEESGSDE